MISTGDGGPDIISRWVCRIRAVAPDGRIRTVAGNGTCAFNGDGKSPTDSGLTRPAAMAFDPAGNLYIADTHANRIRRVSGGKLTTIAGTNRRGYNGDGGAASDAYLADPDDLRFDGSGNLYVSDWGNNRVRRISPDGKIETVAGVGSAGSGGDGGPATAAQLNLAADIENSAGIALDGRGNLFIADTANHRIRKVSA